jgi:predicted glycosyltransferase
VSPTVLIHVQHLLGIGHLQRAAAIALALKRGGARVVLASGGVPVDTVERKASAAGVEIAQLPMARAGDSSFSMLLDEQGRPVDDAWRERRRAALLELFEKVAPDAVVTEMYPFGRRPFRFELGPLLEAARTRRALIAASVRDVLVAKRKPGRAEETVQIARAFYDLVLVHGDARLIPLEASFPQAAEIAAVIRTTGYVTEAVASSGPKDRRSGEVLVSAGGGAVGHPLLAAAIAARPLSHMRDRPWRVIAGANLPEAEYAALQRQAAGQGELTLERFRSDFRDLLARCRVSVSQGGYNTVLEILASRTPAVIVPFAEGQESEQTDRVRRLAEKGLVRFIPQDQVTPQRLAEEIDRAAAMELPAFALDLDGAARSAEILLQAVAERR